MEERVWPGGTDQLAKEVDPLVSDACEIDTWLEGWALVRATKSTTGTATIDVVPAPGQSDWATEAIIEKAARQLAGAPDRAA